MWPAGEKNQNERGASVWFVFGKERVMAERLCSGRIRSWLGLWPATGGDG